MNLTIRIEVPARRGKPRPLTGEQAFDAALVFVEIERPPVIEDHDRGRSRRHEREHTFWRFGFYTFGKVG